MDSERVIIAGILRSRGIKGEVVAISLTDVPGRFEQLTAGMVRLASGADVAVEIERVWPHGEHWVFKFSGVDSMTDADRFRGSELWVPREERGKLPDGEYFRSDLLGCVLEDRATGQAIGVVQGFEQYGGPLLLEVDVNGRKALVPFVPEICETVDVEAKRIKAALPEGLLEL